MTGSGLDGIVAKRLDQAYQPGRRAMQKYKRWQTVDCVVGGAYLGSDGQSVESVLLGLYDDDGKLHYVGHSTVRADARAITEKLKRNIGGQGFSGRSPGGKDRWSGRERKVVPLRPELVVEARTDHITDRHFRHGARILRWRTDKEPRDCTMDQIERR
jgi:ATP-dependent DNA ligase